MKYLVLQCDEVKETLRRETRVTCIIKGCLFMTLGNIERVKKTYFDSQPEGFPLKVVTNERKSAT